MTTAICESLGKEADCYELRLLKDYRDQYMESDPERKEMVDEYYDIAPTIVKRMDRCDNRKELYQDLYDRYLSLVSMRLRIKNTKSAVTDIRIW